MGEVIGQLGTSELTSRPSDGSGGDIVMIPRRVDRRLTAILAADVAEYSRLMRADEDATLRGLTACRAIVDALVAEHRGRIANTAGDALLAEFPKRRRRTRLSHRDPARDQQAVRGFSARAPHDVRKAGRRG